MLITDLEKLEFFEGTEKLLEIWFDFPENSGHKSGLRTIPHGCFKALVKHVNAEVVSFTSNEYIDSYVLSESSMFVAKDRFVIKTCGKTKLLSCVKPLIDLVKKYLHVEHVKNMFYSRRVYLKPELQEERYQSFDQEVEHLQELFPHGTSYSFGNNKGEEWFLYTLDEYSEQTDKPDATLEILMSDLDQDTMLQFTKSRYPNGEKMTEGTGIAGIIPDSTHDGVVFDPCGYSMNGLIHQYYSTIHITPQPQCSYVSYETNFQMQDYSSLVSKVLQTFKPGKFIVTLFANEYAHCGSAAQAMNKLSLDGYRCVDLEDKRLKNYTLAYGHFESSMYY